MLPALRRLEHASLAVEALAREVRSGKRALVTIGCVTSGMFETLPPIVRALQIARPDVVISVREMDTAVALEALRSGEVDVALARLDRACSPLRILQAAPDWFVAALPNGDPLSAGASVDLRTFEGRPMVVLPCSISPAYSDGMVSACRQAGFNPVAAREVTSVMAQLALVASGLGVALVSSGMACLALPGVTFRPLAVTVPTVGVTLAWNSERETDITRALVKLAESGGQPRRMETYAKVTLRR